MYYEMNVAGLKRRLPLCRSIHRRRIRGRNFRNILP